MPLTVSPVTRVAVPSLPVLPRTTTELPEGRALQLTVLAEDDPTDRALFVRMAADFGWAVEGTTNGQEMAERVLERQRQHFPVDCIVLDWRMPKLDGIEALSALRERIGSEQMPLVIMVTAADQSALEAAIQGDRPDSVLTKPIEPSSLFNAVNNAVVAHGWDRDHLLGFTRIGNDHGRWLHDVRVMVVDDSRTIRRTAETLLEREGFTVITADDGFEALSRIVESEPDIVFLDEPTTGLDPQARRNFWQLVEDIKQRGKTVVLTTHYMEEAYQLCDTLAIMDRGRIVAEGSPDALLAQHFDDRILQLPAEDLDGRPLPPEYTVLRRRESAEISTRDVNTALRDLLAAGVPLERLSIRSRTLEDLFLELTGKDLREA